MRARVRVRMKRVCWGDEVPSPRQLKYYERQQTSNTTTTQNSEDVRSHVLNTEESSHRKAPFQHAPICFFSLHSPIIQRPIHLHRLSLSRSLGPSRKTAIKSGFHQNRERSFVGEQQIDKTPIMRLDPNQVEKSRGSLGKAW